VRVGRIACIIRIHCCCVFGKGTAAPPQTHTYESIKRPNKQTNSRTLGSRSLPLNAPPRFVFQFRSTRHACASGSIDSGCRLQPTLEPSHTDPPSYTPHTHDTGAGWAPGSRQHHHHHHHHHYRRRHPNPHAPQMARVVVMIAAAAAAAGAGWPPFSPHLSCQGQSWWAPTAAGVRAPACSIHPRAAPTFSTSCGSAFVSRVRAFGPPFWGRWRWGGVGLVGSGGMLWWGPSVDPTWLLIDLSLVV
jgi:hypothetical protein